MSTSSPVRPANLRKSSRLPGGFGDEEDELDLSNETSDLEHSGSVHENSELPYLPDESSGLRQAHDARGNMTMLHEEEMNNRLLDVESSDLPEVSHIGPARESGGDDTYMFGVPNDSLIAPARLSATTAIPDTNTINAPDQHDFGFRSPKTPPDSYKTPAPETQVEHTGNIENTDHNLETPDAPNTSALETLSSSPTTAAAARTVSRVISMASLGGYETADEQGSPESPTKKKHTVVQDDQDVTPRKNTDDSSSLLQDSTTDSTNAESTRSTEADESLDSVSGTRTKRPKYLQSRQSTQRLSQSSIVSSTTDAASDATLGADFALQSGGAAPGARSNTKSKRGLSRATSLGSMASGLSALSDDETLPSRRNFGTSDLSTLDEEDRPTSSHQGPDGPEAPSTPKASATNFDFPTDTVIANNVRDLEVPGTFARQYRQTHRSVSPDKTPFATTPATARGGKNMTLKEHRSTVDRLGKENFDLKMKIHFLDQALQRRSEDGIKEMITENVQLKSDKLRLEKDNHGLRKSVRELEKKLKDRESGETTAVEKDPEEDERLADAEDEILWLREQVESYEVEIRKMRSDVMARESDKRKLAEMVKSLGETRATGTSDIGSREERDMWKDMLEAETAAREQADDENRKLREEVEMLRAEASNLNRHSNSRRNRFSAATSQTGSIDRDRDGSIRDSISGSTLMEMDRLKHENSELQKVISAQTSTLTSRNREKERLYQEIEELKLGRRADGRSVAGDSIFERSASRDRSPSRMSEGTRLSRMSDNEREGLEAKNGELRDQVSELRLANQNLQTQLDEAIADLDAMDGQAQADVDQLNEELHLLSLERDNALREAEEIDINFQNLKEEAQKEIDGLGDELDQRLDECQRLEAELRNQQEDFKALQAEMRSATEGIIRLEADAQSNLQRYKAVSAELEDSNKELEALEKSLAEASSKIQRLTVQQESSHNEIAFLREEQDADKIKIGDLEAALKTTSVSLSSERERARDLERRLAEERHQREVVGSKEKQEVQRIMNDLNRQASTAQDDVRRLKKVVSSRDIELSSWKDRLTEFEHNLRDLFGDRQATRATLLTSISTLQKDFDATSMELEAVRTKLGETEEMLADRDRLLEGSGHEFRKIADALERERQGRRADKHSFEQSLRSHQQTTRSISQSNSRIAELEAARQADRKKLTQAEAQYKEQLGERNSVLLQLWKKLSILCGPDWAHSNSLINGNLPSQEVIGNGLFWPGFSRNLLLAAKQVEGTVGVFKDRIKRTERELWKEYQALEHTLDVRMKRLDRVEEAVNTMHVQQRPISGQDSQSAGEISKLKGENRLLKAELSLVQQQHSPQRGGSGLSTGGIPPRGSSTRGSGGASNTPAMMASTLMRHHSSNIVEHLAAAENSEHHNMRSNSVSSRSGGRDGSLMIPAYNGNNDNNNVGTPYEQEKWIHRLRELERRLKAEREARLLDRSGARKRLEERDAVNESLRMQLERERMRNETGIVSSNGKHA